MQIQLLKIFKIMKIGPRHNLLITYSDLSDQKIETTINEFVGKDFSSLKIKLLKN